MKTIKHIVLLWLCGTLFLVSCNHDFLNTTPQGEYSEQAVWSDPVLTQAFVNNIYKRLHPSIRHAYVWDALFTDEMTGWHGFHYFQNSLITPDGLGDWEGQTWADFYASIRACNIFFENIDRVNADDAVKNEMRGQVHFLRAYNYHSLVQMYGGVPIIKHAYSLADSFKTARDTYADCIQFIVEDCNAAADLLPLVQSGANNGRVTKGAAMTLKSRVLLHAASDLRHTNVAPSFPNPALLAYTDGNQTVRWQAARDAAKQVIDLGIYQLNKANPGPDENVASNITERYLSKGNEEDIWVRFFTARSRENRSAQVCSPNGYYGFAHNTPTGDHVDAYEMTDGTTFDWNNSVHAASPYENRDPRFYADIHYEGAPWRERAPNVRALDPVGVIQVGDREIWVNGEKQVQFALDGQRGPVLGYIGTQTGYYVRKFQDPAVDPEQFMTDVPWRYMRYAEVLLNYVEACIELGQEEEARTYLNMIRRRVNMPPVTESGDALKARYRNERRIELAFEDFRFYDVRRWLMGSDIYKPISGVRVFYPLNPDNTTATVPTITRISVHERSWDDKMYHFPIFRAEMDRNDQLIQNPGYF